MEQNYTREGGYRATQQLLTLQPEERPTAIFACNNFLGIGVIEALRDAQLEVPRDMAVVCFDDIEFASALHPFLTVLAQPARTFGSIATQLLLERLDGAETSLPHKVVLPPTLIVRASCGAQLAKLGMRDA
jgi:LacI family transcriptional regulator